MTIVINSFVTVELSDDSTYGKVLEATQLVDKAVEAMMSLPYEETGKAYHEASDVIDPMMEACWHVESPYHEYKDIIQRAYWELSDASEYAYHKRYVGELHEFEAKHIVNGVFVGDDDDWNFYSDWHKDIWGHRPHHVRRA